MTLIYTRLLIDFGLVVLIWIIQLVVYPSFQYYDSKNLIVWHKRYTNSIGSIVAPLMIAQLFIAIWQVFSMQSLYHVITLILVVLLWAVTFIQFVPIHNKISNGIVTNEILQKLVVRNWLRTLLWSVIFIWGIVKF